MPATSQAQFRAMQAAAHGKSTLGIPKKVGKDFVAATPSTKGLPERRDQMSNDKFHKGLFKPGKTPVAKPEATNQTPHKEQARHNLKKRPGITARVKAGLKKAFPVDNKSNYAKTKQTPTLEGAGKEGR